MCDKHPPGYHCPEECPAGESPSTIVEDEETGKAICAECGKFLEGKHTTD